jgi:aryl-alcohol dehydrogenase-like predicted oxidoreductase
MATTSRRDFFRHSVAAGSAAAVPLISPAAQIKRASDIVELGPKKVRLSRMAVGTGTFGGGRSSNQLRKLGAQGLADLWAYAFERGVNFWDCADGYGTHAAIPLALQKIPREKVAIQTKTMARSAEQTKADIDRFLKEMNTDYIDIVLLHSRMSPKWDELDKGPMEALSEAQAQKKVRTVGISCHSVEAMKIAAASPWLEVCLCRINHAGVRMDADTATMEPLIAGLKKAGKGVLAMKVLGEGQLKDRIDDALRFALSRPYIDAFTIGIESVSDFQDTFDRIVKVQQA